MCGLCTFLLGIVFLSFSFRLLFQFLLQASNNIAEDDFHSVVAKNSVNLPPGLRCRITLSLALHTKSKEAKKGTWARGHCAVPRVVPPSRELTPGIACPTA
jgi:hypothetical protein